MSSCSRSSRSSKSSRCSCDDCVDYRYERTCHVDRCSRKHAFLRIDPMRPDIRIYSDFCVDHTCKYCVLGLEMCNRPKELQDRFCSEHRRCGVTGCDRTGDCPSGVPLPWKCPDREFRPLGKSPGVHDADVQPPTDKCYVDNCYKTREKLYGYCLDHRCRVASCFERRTVDSEYCVDHVSRICRELKCREPVHADNRCLLHQRCTVKDCKGFRLSISDGGYRDFCDKHYTENRCTYKGCDNVCLKGCRSCATHKCTYEGCLSFRDNEVDAEKVFCREHGCGGARCYAVAAFIDGGGFRPFCRRHTCTIAGCVEIAELGVHCHRHRCHWKSCERPCLSGGEYCADHQCRRSGCRTIVRLPLGYCAEHCCKIDKCVNYCDVTTDRICFEHSREDQFRRIKHLEDRLRDRDYSHSPLNHHVHHPHFGDLQIRHDKLTRDYDECVNRLNASRDEIRILRTTWVSADDNRIWRKEIEDRNARLLLDLDREQKRTEHWERKAVELGRRIDDLEVLLAEERLRHPKSDEYVRQIADLVRKVEILEEELRIERLSHHAHEGRQHEIDRLRRTIEELERKLKGDHIKVDQLQSIIAGEREQKDILLEEIAKRDEFERQRREDRRRPRRGSWERRSRDSRPWGSVF
ncbi:hypothetical protein CDEST_01816 [Colletotrichum destructivum]|uniref:Uncharacterized protein n=1 Tax=Colletotrichum destructivum TaxID=34406 RepID=A0AAX4I111_9PEZI|nr:hypothetical protein CDEST_01816 [Colletotrichum destructivum]